jgi:AcrR family transcriptional regulator
MNNLPKPRRTRADAVRNREQILRAAVDVLVERGPTAPLDMIARQAGVGVATLYRHFPDRTALLRHVALDVLSQAAAAAKAALAEEADAFTALTRYMHAAIDLRIGVVMPLLANRLPLDEDMTAASEASLAALADIVRAAHEEGSLRPDVGSGDVGLLMIRMTPPLPVAISPEDNHRLSHRHAELVLDGLLRLLAEDSLPGRALSIADLGEVHRDGDGNYTRMLDDRPSRCTQVTNPRDDAGTGDRSTTNGS